MPELSQQDFSQHFTNLIGRRVVFEKTLSKIDTKQKKIYATYRSIPSEAPIVVVADLCVLGSLAGALVGLPDTEVQSRLAGPALDDLMNDAISEIFNVATAMMTTEERAVFTSMSLDQASLADAEAQVLAKPTRHVTFNITVENYQGGRLQIFT